MRRNKGRGSGLIQSFTKHACMCVFLLAFNKYLWAYGKPGSILGSKPMGQGACSHEVYGAGADEGCGGYTMDSKRQRVMGRGWYIIWVTRKSSDQMTSGQGTE